jgi:hypothetical protein
MPHLVDMHKVRLIFSRIISFPAFPRSFHSSFIRKPEDFRSSTTTVLMDKVQTSYKERRSATFLLGIPFCWMKNPTAMGEEDAPVINLRPLFCWTGYQASNREVTLVVASINNLRSFARSNLAK